MHRFSAVAAGGLLFAVAVVFGPAQAMEIRQFDKMAGADQDEYIADLVEGAEKVLTDEHRPDLSAQVSKLFTTHLGNDQISVGMTEFSINLVRARLADAERFAKEPSAHRLEVEDAMLVTLKKNNIPLSEDFIRAFRAINSGFRPKH
jgi:hypothetical protein